MTAVDYLNLFFSGNKTAKSEDTEAAVDKEG